MNKALVRYSRIILTLLTLGGIWLLPATAPAAAATYRLVTLEYPPYEYSEDGVIKGAAVEIVREAFKLMGHEVIIEILPFARSIDMLKNGDADGIFTFFRTPERESFAFFSQEAVVQQRISLWVRKDSKITFDGNLTSLKDYRFGVVRKTSYGERFDGAVKKGTLKIAESYTIEEAIKLLVNGRVDIWVSNHDGAVFELKKIGQSKEVKELLPSLQNIPAYVGFSRKRNLEGLRNDFDAALRTLKKSGKYAIILKGYSH